MQRLWRGEYTPDTCYNIHVLTEPKYQIAYSVLVLTGAYTFYQCGVCAKKFCSKCSEKVHNAIPSELRHPDALASKALSPEGMGYLCKADVCIRQCRDHWMIDFRSRKTKILWQRLEQFLATKTTDPMFFFEKPKVSFLL
jgi:hypothetical protein